MYALQASGDAVYFMTRLEPPVTSGNEACVYRMVTSACITALDELHSSAARRHMCGRREHDSDAYLNQVRLQIHYANI